MSRLGALCVCGKFYHTVAHLETHCRILNDGESNDPPLHRLVDGTSRKRTRRGANDDDSGIILSSAELIPAGKSVAAAPKGGKAPKGKKVQPRNAKK